MDIRYAQSQDIDDILHLLGQVNLIHHLGRPDIFKKATKYTRDQLEKLIKDERRPILVAVENNHVLGYMFGIFEITHGDNILIDDKTLYIDDICVDENARGQHVGQTLYEATKNFAREHGCRRITLNVWSFNDSAKSFYEKMGMHPLKTTLEDVL